MLQQAGASFLSSEQSLAWPGFICPQSSPVGVGLLETWRSLPELFRKKTFGGDMGMAGAGGRDSVQFALKGESSDFALSESNARIEITISQDSHSSGFFQCASPAKYCVQNGTHWEG